jgi:SSS family solute:Na+ symporter
MTPQFAGILAYLVVQLAIGAWVSRRIRTEDDYLLAGRQLGPVLGTFSIFATWFGAETCIGSAGGVYERGMLGAATDPFGYGLCLLTMGLLLAIPLWKQRITTLADLFSRHYSPGVERFAVLLLVPTSVLWAAAQLKAFGHVLAASSTLTPEIACAIATVVVLVYTVSGGLMADAVTDLIQGIFLIVGLVVLAALILARSDGGAAALFSAVPPERLNPLGGPDVSWWTVAETWAIPVFGSVTAQELVSRVIATRSPTVARRATLTAASIYLMVGLIPLSIGLVGAQIMPGLSDSEEILPRLASMHMPGLLYVLFAGALVSAILSTVDTALLVAGSLISHNVVLPMRPGLSEAGKVKAARIFVVAAGLVAFVLALTGESVYALVEEASGFGSSGIVVCVFAALFVPGARVASAWCSLVAGIVSWVLGAYVFAIETPFLVSLGCALAGFGIGHLMGGAPRGRGQPTGVAGQPSVPASA